MSDPVVEAGREAWQRIKDRDRATYDEYLILGEALIVARTACMKLGGTNFPHGKVYNRAMRKWLDENGLSDTTSRLRSDVVKCIENRAAIARWREGLTDAEVRRCNHPSTVLTYWRRNQRPVRSGPKARHIVKPALGRPTPNGSFRIDWPQDAIKRAALAMRQNWSNDTFKLARVALEAAVPDGETLLALLPAPAAASAPRAPAQSAEVGEHALA